MNTDPNYSDAQPARDEIARLFADMLQKRKLSGKKAISARHANLDSVIFKSAPGVLLKAKPEGTLQFPEYATTGDGCFSWPNGGGTVSVFADVHPDAEICYGAYVGAGAFVGRWAKIWGNSRVFGHVTGNSRVYENAIVGPASIVRGNSEIHGNAILEDAEIEGRASISGNVYLRDDVRVGGEATVTTRPTRTEYLIVSHFDIKGSTRLVLTSEAQLRSLDLAHKIQ